VEVDVLTLIAVGWVVPSAQAGPIIVEWRAATSFVERLSAPEASVPTLTGAWEDDGVFDPRLRLGLSGRVLATLTPRDQLWASWGFWRDQALCDTCAAGGAPGWLGSELLGSTDLIVRLVHQEPLEGRAAIAAHADVVLPASRDALWCNPMVAAPGAGAAFQLPVRGTTVLVGASARRPFYLHQAAPIGICSPPLAGDVDIAALTGPVEPASYDGAWFGFANPRLTGTADLTWADPHRLIPGAPWRLDSELTTGLQLERAASDPQVRVLTDTGLVTVEAANRPVRVTIPWRIARGWALRPTTTLELSAGNRIPSVLADPGGTFRALPATTTFSAALSGRL
jgi:hypothetical protein